MTAPGEILEYEVHLTSQEIKEEPEDEVEYLQVRNMLSGNKLILIIVSKLEDFYCCRLK